MKHRRLALGTLMLACASFARAGELHATVRDQRGKPVEDAVIVAMPADPRSISRPKTQPAIVDQVDKQFVPFVRVISVGSSVRFPNKDNIRHQVYSFSPAKRFELPLYAGAEAAPVTFATPGVVVLGCNIHDWMLAYIYVADTPFFSQTNAAGIAAIDDLPAGSYRVRVWHPGMEGEEKATEQTLELGAGDSRNLQWRITVKALPRIPRTTGEAGASYP